MYKGVKKNKIKKGKDSNKALMRKLVRNFIISGKLKTTHKRANALKSVIEKLVFKARDESEATLNAVHKVLGSGIYVDKLFKVIGPKFSSRTGGYVRVKKIGSRIGDGAEMSYIEWVEPVVADNDKKEQVTPKQLPLANDTDKVVSEKKVLKKDKNKSK